MDQGGWASGRGQGGVDGCPVRRGVRCSVRRSVRCVSVRVVDRGWVGLRAVDHAAGVAVGVRRVGCGVGEGRGGVGGTLGERGWGEGGR